MTNEIYHLHPGVWRRFIFTVMGDLESLIDVNIEGWSGEISDEGPFIDLATSEPEAPSLIALCWWSVGNKITFDHKNLLH